MKQILEKIPPEIKDDMLLFACFAIGKMTESAPFQVFTDIAAFAGIKITTVTTHSDAQAKAVAEALDAAETAEEAIAAAYAAVSKTAAMEAISKAMKH